MRKLLIIIIFLFHGLMIWAQVEKPRNLPAFDTKQLHWGFTVGLNSMDYSIKRDYNYEAINPEDFRYADVIGFQPSGFQVNIVSDLRLTDYWNLRFLPGINLGSRDVVFFTIDRGTPVAEDPMVINSSFLDFPLLLKFRSERVNNYRPYVIGGFSYRLDMSAKQGFGDENQKIRTGYQSPKILTKKSDFYIELGFGVDSYLQYFKHSTELKLAIGLRNILNTSASGLYPQAPYYAESVLALRSFIVMLNFHFE